MGAQGIICVLDGSLDPPEDGVFFVRTHAAIAVAARSVYIQKCRESSPDTVDDGSSQQSVNDVLLTAKLREADLSCQLNDCKEKLLITEQQVQNFALLKSQWYGSRLW